MRSTLPTTRFPGDAVLELQRLSARIPSDLTPADAARAVLVHASAALGANRASVVMHDPDGAIEAVVGTHDVAGTEADLPPELVAPLRRLAAIGEPAFLPTHDDVLTAYPEIGPLRPSAGALAVLPLVSGDDAIGTLFMAFDWEGAFAPTDRDVLLALADVCAGVIERSRLSGRERLSRARLDFLSEASRTLAESLDLEVTLRTAASLAIPILADGAVLDVQLPDGTFERAVSMPIGSRQEAEVLGANRPAPDADHPTIAAMRSLRTIRYEVSDDLIERATRNPEHAAAARRAMGRYAMTSPLVLDGRSFGAITLYRSNAGPYSDDEVIVAEEFVRRAARSIENSRLHSERERALAQARALVELNAAVANADSADDVAGLVLDVVVPLLGGDRGAVFRVDARHEHLIVRRTNGYPAQVGERFTIANTPADRAIRTGEIVLGTSDEWGGTYDLPENVEVRSGAYVIAPLIVANEAIGVVSIGFDEQREIQSSVLGTLRGLVDAGAQAMARASLLEAERRLRERESAVARLNEAAADARSPEDVARVLLSAMYQRLEPGFAAVTLLDEVNREFVLVGTMTGGANAPTVQSRWPAEMPSPARDVVETRAAVLVDQAEYRRRYPEVSSISEPTGISTYLALPLLAAGRAVGALGLSFARPRPFGPVELENLQALSNAGGEAVERARLREGERRALGLLEAVVEELPVGIIIVDAFSGRVLHANSTVAGMLGRQPRVGIHIAKARTVLRLPDGRPLSPAETPLALAIQDGSPQGPVEAILVRDDGTERRVVLDARPVRDDAGRLLAVAGTWTDITEQRSAEAAREAFLGVLSHELRTPITSILAASGILSRRNLGEAESALVADINAESERLHRLVEDLLVLSRVERGADLRRSDPVLVQHVGRRVSAHEASRWPDREFRATIPTGLPAASGDEAYIEQVIRNLLSNAAKYSPAGETIDLVVAAEGDGVAVRVLDHGPGFVDDDLNRVFELFYRAPAATKIAAGAGIGLYTARVLSEAMGGRIWAANRSDAARGAEVGFWLPVAAAEADG